MPLGNCTGKRNAVIFYFFFLEIILTQQSSFWQRGVLVRGQAADICCPPVVPAQTARLGRPQPAHLAACETEPRYGLKRFSLPGMAQNQRFQRTGAGGKGRLLYFHTVSVSCSDPLHDQVFQRIWTLASGEGAAQPWAQQKLFHYSTSQSQFTLPLLSCYLVFAKIKASNKKLIRGQSEKLNSSGKKKNKSQYHVLLPLRCETQCAFLQIPAYGNRPV